MRSSVIAFAVLLAISPLAAGEWNLSGYAGGEIRYFPDDPQFAGQFRGAQLSLVASPKWAWRNDDGRQRISIIPFARIDSRDDERSHVDLREGYWSFSWNDWELLAGVNRVFWGVTESRHLVDIVNQIDTIEDIDREDKLGQPMLQLALQRGWGRLEAFALLGFRQPTFAGRAGRLRFPLPVDPDLAIYESGAEDRRVDFAARYSHYIGDWDVGAYWFHGTGRQPVVIPAAGGTRLTPVYNVIDQIGVDVQYTREAWLWKLEAIGREGQGDPFGAAVGGFEYTLYQVGGGAADVGLLAEYLYDGRDAAAPVTVLEDDVFVGSRLALNDVQDTQALAGAVVDRELGSISAFLEFDRRLGDKFRLELQTRWFLNVDSRDPLRTFEQDSFVNLSIVRYF